MSPVINSIFSVIFLYEFQALRRFSICERYERKSFRESKVTDKQSFWSYCTMEQCPFRTSTLWELLRGSCIESLNKVFIFTYYRWYLWISLISDWCRNVHTGTCPYIYRYQYIHPYLHYHYHPNPHPCDAQSQMSDTSVLLYEEDLNTLLLHARETKFIDQEVALYAEKLKVAAEEMASLCTAALPNITTSSSEHVQQVISQ